MTGNSLQFETLLRVKAGIIFYHLSNIWRRLHCFMLALLKKNGL
jgi:hypothetical protein